MARALGRVGRAETRVEPPRRARRSRSSASFELLNAELAREIIARVHAFTPAFFERLIVDLLLRMGYGGGKLEMGRALGRVGDGGVDGVIKEDELGLDVVYVQAKRFAEEKSVPLREVRDFVGGLEGHRASKGVFVTTSYFPVHGLRIHHPRLQARRADRRPGTRQPDDPPPRRRARQGELRGQADR